MVKRRNVKADKRTSSGGRNDLMIATFFLVVGIIFVGFVVWKEQNKKYAHSLFSWGGITDNKEAHQKAATPLRSGATDAANKVLSPPHKQVAVRYSDKDRQQLETILNK
jgi:hypothetical protein